MLERIMEVGNGVYVLWGLGIFGLLLKMMANAYMGRMVRASKDMGETKKRKLRIMRQQYENKRSFGLCGGDESAYAESFVRNLRFLTRPMEFWEKSCRVFCLLTLGAMAGGFLYYDVSWRGSPAMEFFLINGFLVCVFLLVAENIFVINNKVEILKANISGYLMRLPRPKEQTRGARSSDVAGAIQIRRVDAEEEMKRLQELPLDESAAAGEEPREETLDTEPREDSSSPEPCTDSGGDESLNRFLAEFFS